jgi:hypothetical protein
MGNPAHGSGLTCMEAHPSSSSMGFLSAMLAKAEAPIWPEGLLAASALAQTLKWSHCMKAGLPIKNVCW